MTIGRIPSVEGGIQPTIVDAKGDLIAGVAADSVNRLAVGSNDQVLVADSAASTGLAWKSYGAQFVAGKNKIINGDFGVWQRGTSSTASGYLADRFQYNAGTATSFSQSRQTFTPGAAPVAGYEGKFFWRGVVTTVGSETAWYLNNFIEDVQTLAGQTVTLSFWAKADTTRNVTMGINQNFGSGGSSVVGTDFGTKSITTSWTRLSFTATMPSISGKTIGTGSFLQVYWAITPASGMTIDIWGVQLEAGSVATPFTTATGTIQGELAACQRYYQKSYPQGTAPAAGFIFQGAAYGSTASAAANGTIGQVRFPVVMRTGPAVTMYSYTSGTANVISNAAGTDQGAGTGVASGIGDSGFGIYNSSVGTVTLTNGYIIHYVASAEL